MGVIAVVILLERSWSRGDALARAVGVALVAAGLLTPFVEWLVPVLHDVVPMGEM